MQELLLKLLNRLQQIGEGNEEIGDTVCRNAMARAIFNAFLRPKAGYQFPDEFGFEAPEANLAVRDALMDYTSAACELAPTVGLRTFQERLAAFQDSSVFTEDGGTYDEFFGSYVSGMYSEHGDWLG